ncbi:MAG TPA: replication factor C large subunit [Candidatus Pacearchaeota archaeon]|nr:replication factor C large subunit [Candidatus Pacearchaeota archaeon]
MQWVEKYRPEHFQDVRGQEEAISKLVVFVQKFGRSASAKKAAILYGPPGVGKTTIAQVVANETKSEIFELNASDLRNRDNLREILKPASEQMSLSKERKIILIDEVDGISEADWGGLPELMALIDSTNWPMILTANDVWGKKFVALRKKSEFIQLKEIDYKTIKDVLISILRKENKFIDNNILTAISVKAKGDLRAAINDLQVAASMENPSAVLDNERNIETDVFNALRMIFKGAPNSNVTSVFDSVDVPIDEIMLWIEENIPLEYQGEELYKAYESLSKADIFKGRIYKQQYWRFLLYQNIFLSYGISAAKQEAKTGFTNYKKPERVLKIWLNNQRVAKKKSIAEKYAKFMHIGEKRALHEFPVIKNILKDPKIRKELKLEQEEIEYLDRDISISSAN